MANAGQAAAVRVIIATAAVTSDFHVTHFDEGICAIQVDSPEKLGGTLASLHIQDAQMPAYRSLLAGLCPEVKDVISDSGKFPLNTGLLVSDITNAVAGQLVASPNFKGNCVPSSFQATTGTT
jgi:hypothetical protein